MNRSAVGAQHVTDEVTSSAELTRSFNQSSAKTTTLTSALSETDQMNFIALRAAIEVARATGHQGRSPGTAALEIQDLAERAAKITSELNSTTREIGQDQDSIHFAVDEILSAARDMAATVYQIAEDVASIVQSAKRNSAVPCT
jgi:methyl-accepting chemotaxis protein